MCTVVANMRIESSLWLEARGVAAFEQDIMAALIGLPAISENYPKPMIAFSVFNATGLANRFSSMSVFPSLMKVSDLAWLFKASLFLYLASRSVSSCQEALSFDVTYCSIMIKSSVAF